MSSELAPSPSLPSPTVPILFTSLTPEEEEKWNKHEAAIAHLALCVAYRDQCELDLKNFRLEHPNESVINADPVLSARHLLLITAKNEAWEAYFKAHKAAHPKTIEDILWIMAKAGHTQLVAPLMNLSKVTRNCIYLKAIMMNVKNRRGKTQLHHCAREGFTTSVKRLLSIRNINVYVKDDKDRSTPLHDAAYNGHVEIANLLLQNGAELNARRDNGDTPLHDAADKGHVEITRLLLQNGAEVNSKSKWGNTPLHDAAWNGHEKISRLLLQNGANVNTKSISGFTPLHRAAMKGHIDILHLLVENGADLEAQHDDGWRALHFAARFGHLPFIQDLISRYHVDINARMDESTALSITRNLAQHMTALKMVKSLVHNTIMAYIQANGGIE